MTTRCTFAHVDLAALQSNFRAIAEFLAEQTRLEGSGRKVPGIISVVKANAYGHGAAAVGRALQDADMILFIYREEVYDKNTPRKGEADIDLAKHRNG